MRSVGFIGIFVTIGILVACSHAPEAISPPAPMLPDAFSASTTSASALRTIPFFESSFAFGGKTYTYKMVGSNPFSAPGSVTIPTEIIPVELRFANGDVFDPTPAIDAIYRSPLFRTGAYTAGTAQYGDAVMRSEFWKFVASKDYHVLLTTPTVEPTFVLTVPPSDGSVGTTSGVRTAFLTASYFLNQIEPQLLSAYHVSPASLTFFAVTDMRLLESGGSCCYNGYHSSFTVTSATGTSTYTMVWGYVSATTPTLLSHVSHEVAEWLNDPFYPSHPNIVPAWVHPLANVCDGDLLEVGDPLVGVQFTVDGDTVQDVAFLSWFSRASPSFGIDGRYDLLGKLTKPAAVC